MLDTNSNSNKWTYGVNLYPLKKQKVDGVTTDKCYYGCKNEVYEDNKAP